MKENYVSFGLPEQERNARIEAGLPQAAVIAREYLDSGLSYDDLVQVGCIGLIKAVDSGTDPEPLIRSEIENFIRE